ncbi:MAG: sialidase family protein [Bacillota bacterium]
MDTTIDYDCQHTPRGAVVSAAGLDFLRTLEQQEEKTGHQAFTRAPVCPAAGATVTCGNGNSGAGALGERQVNDPQQDVGVPDNNITQSETSLASFCPFILFGFNDSNCAAFGNFSGFAFSSDGGNTWSDCGSTPRNPGWRNGGDPVIAVDRKGVFYYAQLSTTDTGESVISVSTATINPNNLLITMNLPFAAGVGSTATGFQDKEWTAVGKDITRRLALWHFEESLHVTWTDFLRDNQGNLTSVGVRYSKWSTGVNPQLLIPSKTIVNSSVQASFPLLDRRGILYVFYEDFTGPPPTNRSIRLVRSFDAGQTFSTPIMVSPVNPVLNAVACNRNVIQVTQPKNIRIVFEYPHAAVGPDNTIYVVWQNGRPGGGSDILIAYSRDCGDTWTVRQVTDTDVFDFFPSVIVNKNGAHVQYARFNGAAGVGDGTFALFKRTFTIAGGAGPESMVSTVFSMVPDTNPNFDDQVANCYMGDYNQIVLGQGGTLLHAWSDNRNNPNGNNPDVFFIKTLG